MQKSAFISDIHSNLYALKAVINDIQKQNVDKIYCLGDIAGYHSLPNEVIELVKESGIICIKGNHDQFITDKLFQIHPAKHRIEEWNFNTLSEANRDFLKSLPTRLTIKLGIHTLLLVHGSPSSINQYLREDSNETRDALDNLDEDILLCGHTHIPYYQIFGEKMIVNTGSVGKPKIGRPNATYVVLHAGIPMPKVEIREVEYPWERMASHVRQCGLPEHLAEALSTGNP